MSIELAEKKSHFGDESNESSSMIEVVCARVNDGRPDVQTYRVMQGTTAAAFLRLQGLVAESQSLPVMGVFSQKIAQPEQYVLQQGHRLELYQPLILSPMDVRRARARAHPVGRLMHRRF
jgi:putative ubiquitin-RnfH superfamily antitoxin RatB of RatAB toxin-antitoxin module